MSIVQGYCLYFLQEKVLSPGKLPLVSDPWTSPRNTGTVHPEEHRHALLTPQDTQLCLACPVVPLAAPHELRCDWVKKEGCPSQSYPKNSVPEAPPVPFRTWPLPADTAFVFPPEITCRSKSGKRGRWGNLRQML